MTRGNHILILLALSKVEVGEENFLIIKVEKLLANKHMNKFIKVSILFILEFVTTFFVVFALVDRFDGMIVRGNSYSSFLIYAVSIIPALFFVFMGWINARILTNSGWHHYAKSLLITLGIFLVWFLLFGQYFSAPTHIPSFILSWYGCLGKTQNWCDLGVVWFPLTFGLGEAIIGTLVGTWIGRKRQSAVSSL